MGEGEVVGSRTQWGGVGAKGAGRLSALGGSILNAQPGGGAASGTGSA